MSVDILARLVFGCSVCFGAKGHPLSNGLNLGILSLLMVVAFVLILFATFFLQLRAKSKNVNLHQ